MSGKHALFAIVFHLPVAFLVVVMHSVVRVAVLSDRLSLLLPPFKALRLGHSYYSLTRARRTGFVAHPHHAREARKEAQNYRDGAKFVPFGKSPSVCSDR